MVLCTQKDMLYIIALYIHNALCYGRKNDGPRLSGAYIGLVPHSSPSNDLCPRLSLHAFFSGRGKPVPGVGNRPGRESTKCNGMRDIMTDQTGVLTQDP